MEYLKIMAFVFMSLMNGSNYGEFDSLEPAKRRAEEVYLHREAK